MPRDEFNFVENFEDVLEQVKGDFHFSLLERWFSELFPFWKIDFKIWRQNISNSISAASLHPEILLKIELAN